MPAILDSLFHKVVDTTSSSVGVEGGGGGEPREWGDLPIQKSLYGQMASIHAVLAPHITKCSYIDAQSHLPVLW